MPVLVQNVVVAVPRDVVLEHAGSSRRGWCRRTSGRGGRRKSGPMRSATRRAIRSFSSAAARSVKVNATIDAGSAPSAIRRRHPARDGLGLARAGAGDDLKVRATVVDDLLLLRDERVTGFAIVSMPAVMIGDFTRAALPPTGPQARLRDPFSMPCDRRGHSSCPIACWGIVLSIARPGPVPFPRRGPFALILAGWISHDPPKL